MTIVTPGTLADRLGKSASDVKIGYALEAAEALIAAYVGASTLAETDQTERIRPPRDRDSLEIAYGPLTSITSMTIEGEAVTLSDLSPGFWGIGLVDLSKKFSQGKTAAIAYKSGWLNEAALPANVKEAILIVGQQAYTLDATGRLKSSEAVGDYSVSYESSQLSGLNPIPVTATALLTRYRRPQI